MESTVENVETFWTKARISTITEISWKVRTRGLIEGWRLLKKSRGGDGDTTDFYLKKNDKT